MKTIIGAAIGNCVHAGGIYSFLKLAEAEGYITKFLGPAIPVRQLVEALSRDKPDIMAVSYRLTPEVARLLFEELKHELTVSNLVNQRMIFGGTPPVAAVAAETGLFEKVFDGTETIEEIRKYLSGGDERHPEDSYANDLIGRIRQKYPYPLLRHHYGRPTLEETLSGIAGIARSGMVDIISIGPDQNAQEHFFNPEKMDPKQDGAGGVPLRKAEDLRSIYADSRCGNYPLLRCYAGTRELIRWAEMSVDTIHNAWAAIPLCWYSEIDRRSKRSLTEAIKENQEVMKWYAIRGIPVEVNESHQWSLRNAHDALAVTMFFLAAYNAKKIGVRNYVAQFMFNTPPGTTAEMDIAKMLAKLELAGELIDDHFSIYREVRAGLAHFSSDPDIAKGQLAASAVISLSLKPHIYHVVGYSEGDHATTAEELIESCRIIHGVLRNCLHGLPEFGESKAIINRKKELISEARDLLSFLWDYGKESGDDPWTDPVVLSAAVKDGILDTPHFTGLSESSGKIRTRLIDGAWYAVNEKTGKPISEKERTSHFRKSFRYPVK